MKHETEHGTGNLMVATANRIQNVSYQDSDNNYSAIYMVTIEFCLKSK